MRTTAHKRKWSHEAGPRARPSMFHCSPGDPVCQAEKGKRKTAKATAVARWNAARSSLKRAGRTT
eukprot:5942325-Pyramimonas_sp.AAC.1